MSETIAYKTFRFPVPGNNRNSLKGTDVVEAIEAAFDKKDEILKYDLYYDALAIRVMIQPAGDRDGLFHIWTVRGSQSHDYILLGNRYSTDDRVQVVYTGTPGRQNKDVIKQLLAFAERLEDELKQVGRS